MKSGQTEIVETSKGIQKSGLMSRRIAILEFILRIVAFFNTIGSAILMGTTHETLPFFTQFIRFQAEYNDLPALTFFVVANAVVSGYLILSLTLAFVHIVKSKTQNSRILLIVLDVVMLGLLTAGASSAAAIVYLAHNGNNKTNWNAICQQFNSFCERISGSLIGSFIAVVLLILLILLSAIALSRRH
ncbi:PREDICTED: casparian strip membrane protein 5 [Camelina sativa]|uniref:CASP-like protein n=1 Tax=Camelina sativa TaxID=90675 RepID=A0ABM0VBB0_CAMSA|nr:PREDICTED: casparian strip membrane protein 5 [Camelina sativa]